jgi:hypothetical protein
MGITAEQIAAQNQAAQDEMDFFESLLSGAATQRETAAAQQAAAQQAAAEQAATEQVEATVEAAPTYERLPGQTDLSYDFLSGLAAATCRRGSLL